MSVARSLWEAGGVGDAVFLADYAINPLGTSSDEKIAAVADDWTRRAAETSDTLVIACNTLSIRHRQLRESSRPGSEFLRVISMVDCFEAMVVAERERLVGQRVLVIGTEFTASQRLYPDILQRGAPGTKVSTVAATELERKIARMEEWDGCDDASLTDDLRGTLDQADVAILACTCFPMVKDDLRKLYPDVVFLDPGAYCHGQLSEGWPAQRGNLAIDVSGDIVPERQVVAFAKSYLGKTTVVSLN